MIHALVIFISAFLIFLVQPLIAKQILPWFGGSAAVWATCLLFFQTALLAGYAYADALTRWLQLKHQVVVHTTLLVLAAICMPIIVADHWRPIGTEEPIGRILGLLAATIGLPYFMLATTTPLVGAWYWRKYRASAPYRLFALSNFASLLALLGFPFLMEPWIGNREIAWVWSVLFVVFAILCATLAWKTFAWGARDHQSAHDAPIEKSETSGPPGASMQATRADSGWPQWIALSGVGSAMLLGVSTHLTQNISSAPLLWVVPLALYLITFIISFDHPRWYVRSLFLPAAAVLLPLMAWYSDSLELAQVTPIYALGLFVVCMVCHGELARLKPEPARLTQFYLATSVGGALGSLLMAVVAPLVLKGYYEFWAALVVAGGVGMFLTVGASGALRWGVRAGALAVTVAVTALSYRAYGAYTAEVRYQGRDFYGVVRTRDSGQGQEAYRNMIHGAIAHGGQLLEPDLQMTASSYFGPTSGYGRVFKSLPDAPRRVGVIGLGAGALAAYARTGDHWVFYEISPTMVDAAQKEFTFLAKLPSAHEIVVGDGRLALEREAPRQFDVLAMDAFSGDSVPSHLLTREAMAIYLKHLKPDGVIVFQATNRFVNLMPAIYNLAEHFGLHAVLVSDSPSFSSGPEYWLSSTDQVIVTRKKEFLDSPAIKEVAEPLERKPGLRIFTDDYINLFRILKL